MDLINFISKDQGFPGGEILKEYDAFSVGEILDVGSPEEVLKPVGNDRGEINMAFHFEMYAPTLSLSSWMILKLLKCEPKSRNQ
jgi:hypothetical protein